ncbi:phosphocholine-specific phospholipase C [Streptomyces sp. NPDC018000]|uniref:phosphocholine-specific phospholipase C n=1 Tax=Streptomyces sp. NPDC018000 TaxID=3365028 RepID=UPI00378F4359
MDDIRHVVILMQENRSFDHYFGTLNGVRGFDDRQALTFPNGDSVFHQPALARPDGGFLLPYRMDSTKFDAQNADGLPHDWESGHDAINNGAMNRWTSAKGEQSMGYLTREDIPYQYALADAFTLCDAYFCSLAGPTSPNRLYLWTGTVGPGHDGTTGPWIDNTPLPESPVCDWTTYAERLSAADVTWRVYHTPGLDERYGNYEDNALEYFGQFHTFDKDDPRYINAMTKWDLSAFDAHCKDGILPTVSWLVSPYLFCEHPTASPAHGAHWVNTALQSLFANPEVWRHTVFLVMYDENDGYFDHVVPPFPPAGTPDEFVDGQPIGLGNRVPLWVISPWSRGGWFNSQVFDHTSVLRFLELVTGVREPNISQWRRAVCGDLTSCFDFARPDFSIPVLPDTRALVKQADAASELPAVEPPAPGAQVVPTQEPGGARPRRPLPYRPWADIAVDRATGKVLCTLANEGTAAFPFTVFPNIARPFAGTPFTVSPHSTADYVWDAVRTGGRYDFTVHGADGFVCRFAGTVAGANRIDAAVPRAAAVLGSSDDEVWVELLLSNDGTAAVGFTVTPNDFGGTARTQPVGPRERVTLRWPADGGRYDITITADSDPGFAQRYAGTVHAAPYASSPSAGRGTG